MKFKNARVVCSCVLLVEIVLIYRKSSFKLHENKTLSKKYFIMKVCFIHFNRHLVKKNNNKTFRLKQYLSIEINILLIDNEKTH